MSRKTIEVYADLESLLVSAIREAMEFINHPVLTGVPVSTKRRTGSDAPDKQITVQYVPGVEVARGLRDESFRVNCYAKTYAEASLLASQMEQVIQALQYGNNPISSSSVDVRATRVETPTGEELRTITGSAYIKAKTKELTINT